MVRIVARPETEPKTPLSLRLRELRRALGDPDRDGFAAALGISKNTLAYYERGERTPDADVLLAYSEQFLVNLNWLVKGEGEMRLPGANLLDIAMPPEERRAKAALLATHMPRTALSPAGHFMEDPGSQTLKESQSFIQLPFYSDVSASAGPGAVALKEQPDSVVAFARRFLRDQGAAPEQCSVIRARGDSMAPTIPDASLLIVDHSQSEVANGCIMVINVGDDLLVKRVRRRLDGLIDLVSDNPAYPPETIGRDTIQQLRIVGRVVYFCRAP